MPSIAIVGSGITGLTAARELKRAGHQIRVFESEDRIGGHTHTVPVQVDGAEYWVDTGFIVYNERTYPNFIRLLYELDIPVQPTTMGFSVSDEDTLREYAGKDLGTMAPTWTQKLDPRHWRFMLDIVRFNRRVKADLKADRIESHQRLGEYLDQMGVGARFVREYLYPMGAAIWSTPENDMANFEALFFAKFFFNHGLLDLTQRPQWFTLIGGSRAYLEPISEPFRDDIRLSSPVKSVTEVEGGVILDSDRGPERFDAVVMACHSDQSLALLAAPSDLATDVLSGVPYLDNQVVLHQDASLMPTNRRCWSAWNYRLQNAQTDAPILTYWMNELQCMPQGSPDFFVTVNPGGRVDPAKTLRTFTYAHPQFGPQSPDAQSQLAALNAQQRIVFAGAWGRNGFHEDGHTTGLEAAQALIQTLAEAPAWRVSA